MPETKCWSLPDRKKLCGGIKKRCTSAKIGLNSYTVTKGEQNTNYFPKGADVHRNFKTY